MPNSFGSASDPLQMETRVESREAAPAPPALVPGLTIVYHPEVERIGERVALTGLAAGRPERLARGEPCFAAPGLRPASPAPH